MSDDAIPMLLWCPGCGARHLDVGEFATKLHHTHACQTCGLVWRPAIVATVGVQFLPGFKNADLAPAQPPACILGGARCPAAGACDDGCVRAPGSPAPEWEPPPPLDPRFGAGHAPGLPCTRYCVPRPPNSTPTPGTGR